MTRNSPQPVPAETAPPAIEQPAATPLASPTGRAVLTRKGQYLIAACRPDGAQPANLQPMQFSAIEQSLRACADVDIIDTVGPRSIMGVLADGTSDMPSMLVARMSSQKADIMKQQSQGRLIVERDQSLNMLDTFFRPAFVAGPHIQEGVAVDTVVKVVAPDGTPLRDAEVSLFGSLLPVCGITDDQGMARLSLCGESLESVRGLYVKPKADFWSFYQADPDLCGEQENLVALRPLSDWPTLANFPLQQTHGWGQLAMRLDQVPDDFRGQGIRVAVIDSGASILHDDLREICNGFDVVNKKIDPSTWNIDTMAHGSHCAGVIGAHDNGRGIRGFAPDAELHVCKLFPGGQVSQLIDALEYCIEKQIDVVNLSLGGVEHSQALEQQIARARRAGIACIVAAGNSGNGVQYPASSPLVLAVAAIGKADEFPPDSYHSQTLTQHATQDTSGRYFSAGFTCFGPEIAVCAPGVAITSSVPPNNYAVWDGTSMAAPHVTGLAALVLAHHADFQGPFQARNSERVERLFQIIKRSARHVDVGDRHRTGFGLPDALVALGLEAPQDSAANAGYAGPVFRNPAVSAPQPVQAQASLLPQSNHTAPVPAQVPSAAALLVAIAHSLDPTYVEAIASTLAKDRQAYR